MRPSPRGGGRGKCRPGEPGRRGRDGTRSATHIGSPYKMVRQRRGSWQCSAGSTAAVPSPPRGGAKQVPDGHVSWLEAARLAFPGSPSGVSGGFQGAEVPGKSRSSSQWRGRAGFTPASVGPSGRFSTRTCLQGNPDPGESPGPAPAGLGPHTETRRSLLGVESRLLRSRCGRYPACPLDGFPAAAGGVRVRLARGTKEGPRS